MVKDGPRNVEIGWYDITLVEKFSSVLFPVDTLELLRRLPAIGFVVPELVKRGTPEEGKPLAAKGDIEFLLNDQTKTLGVRGRAPDVVVTSFEELRKFYFRELDPSPSLATHYVEFDAKGWAKTGANPTETINAFWEADGQLDGLSEVVGADVINFGLQLVPANRDANSPDWFHIFIEPHIPSSGSRYRLRCIWRGADVAAMLAKFEKVNEMFRDLLRKFEAR